MSRLSLALAASAALCFSAGCSKQGMHKSESKQATSSSKDPNCPMSVPGAQVSTQETSDGVALIFTTSDPSQVTDLQMRGRKMMVAQAQHAQSETPMDMAQAEDLGVSSTEEMDGVDDTGTGGGGSKGSAGAPTVPSRAMVQDTANGLTVTYSADDGMQKRELIDQVNETARQMKGGHCPGM
ncbi:hypothetical protein D7Y13_05855 [Corallococcus praedator]|uniref:Secreted protein n=1 Tax=Corallococcus praedator TaxID=2316724 RepID=A0ABX9QPJ6_9BACT|nr:MULTISPECIES: hypothetical protein [Corallococcus]RKH18759.1 hypothetical protein D7X74_08695 [Corallococcus sp. CA047B]RKH34724.1 hypothetical protein D7X75_07220 [Corallococcus sp. CA031C]RKI14619.1 hypothetical protein D7Y13_05855 [Corallococcus praedator]